MSTTALGEVVDVSDVLRDERAALLALLHDLDAEAWRAPTACAAWSVHELAVHLVHDDLRRLSSERDGHAGSWIDVDTLEQLVTELDRANESWVATMAPTLSPRLTTELLGWLAEPSAEHLLGLDPHALDSDVGWAGPGPHPNWLDVAREYTERWVHQQQLRDAVDRPGLTDERFAAPVVEAFARAIPPSLPGTTEPASLEVRLTGGVARTWRFEPDGPGWGFADGASTTAPTTTVELPAELFWRRAVRLVDRDAAFRAARIDGDRALADAVLDVRAALVASG